MVYFTANDIAFVLNIVSLLEVGLERIGALEVFYHLEQNVGLLTTKFRLLRKCFEVIVFTLFCHKNLLLRDDSILSQPARKTEADYQVV